MTTSYTFRRPLLLAVCMLLESSVNGFRPTVLVTRQSQQRRLPLFADPNNNINFAEFEYLLQESNSVKLPVSNSRRTQGESRMITTEKTIEASSFPASTYTEEIQQQEPDSLYVGDDEDAMYGGGGVMRYQADTVSAPSALQARFQNMDFQDIVLTLVVPSILLFVAGRWTYNRISTKIQNKLDITLDSFAEEMIYHDGDFEEMKLCVADYGKKLLYLGPKKRDRMVKRYLEAYAKRKTISPQTISSLSYAFSVFKLDEESAANLLVSLCKEMGTEKIASAGKLLFLGSRILKTPQGRQALQPIKTMIMGTYRESAVAETMVDVSQQAMAEAAYKSAVLKAGKTQTSLTPGWEVLGLEKDVAQRIWDETAKDGFLTDREVMYGGQTTRYDKKGNKLTKDGKLQNPDDAVADDTKEPVSGVFECGDCGFTLFVAAGRETKFYGSGFKCPKCGAGKSKFTQRDDFDEDE